MKDEFVNGKYLAFSVAAGARELELTSAVPSDWPTRKGLSVEVRVLSTSSVRVEALALVPLADEIPPPPPEPWKPEQGSGTDDASRSNAR